MSFEVTAVSLPKDALSIFNECWMEKLNEKRAIEAEQQKVVLKKAQSDMSDWASQRDVRLNARKKDSNRCQEQVLLETLESDGDINSIWEEIAKYIDTSNDIQDSRNADVTRMKKLFIQLKNQSVDKSLSSSNMLN